MMVNKIVLNLGFKPTMLTAASFMDDLEAAGYEKYIGWIPQNESLLFYSDGDKDILDAKLAELKERGIILSYELKRVRRAESTLELITIASMVAKEIAFNIYALSDLLTFGTKYIDAIFGASDLRIRDVNTLERLKRIASSDSILKDEMLKQEIIKRTIAME